jgi:hypothetical protein
VIARLRAWYRYNKRLSELVGIHHAMGYNISPAAYERYCQQAKAETSGTAAA